MKLKSLLILCFLGLLFQESVAQNYKNISVNLSGRTFVGTKGIDIPFDEPFNLTGNATGIEKIQLYYRISPSENPYKRWYTLAKKTKFHKYTIAPVDAAGYKIKTEERQDSIYVTVQSTFSGSDTRYSKEPLFDLKAQTGAPQLFKKTAADGSTTQHILIRNNHLHLVNSTDSVGPAIMTSRFYFPATNLVNDDGYITTGVPWEITPDSAVFSLKVDGLHANVNYDFLFFVYFKTNISAADQVKINDELLAILKQDFDFLKINGRDRNSDIKISKRFTATIRKYINKRGELVNDNNSPLIINTDAEPIYTVKQKVIDASTQSLYYSNAISQIKRNLFDPGQALIPSPVYLGLKNDIDGVNTGGIFTLSSELNTLWTGNLPESRQTVDDVSKVVANQAQIISLLQGSGKIDDANGYAGGGAGGSPDPATISLVNKFFKRVESIDFNVKIAASGRVVTLFRGEGFRRLALLFEQLDQALSDGNSAVAQTLIFNAQNPANGLLNDPRSPIATSLAEIAAGDMTHVDPLTAKLLGTTLDPAITEYKDLKIGQAAAFVYQCFLNPVYFNSILTGGSMINSAGSDIQQNSKKTVDKASVKVLISFFRLINSPAFKTNAGTLTFAASTDQLKYIIAQLESLSQKLDLYDSGEADFTTFRNEMSQLMADAFIKKSYLVSGTSTVNMGVEANKNPYVGLDIGTGYAPTLHTLFIHEGLNIYLRPVNKNTPISDLHGSERFFKTVSLFIGITQKVTSSSVNDRYSPLFDDSSFNVSFLFGAGWRFNSLMRLNVAGLFYREKSLNPLVTATQVRVAPSITFAIDINIAKLLKPIANLFP